MDSRYESLDKDFTKHVVFETNKTLVHLKQDKKYGFWSLDTDFTGPMPVKYSSRYTSLNLAIEAAEKYIQDKKLKVIKGPIPFTQDLYE